MSFLQRQRTWSYKTVIKSTSDEALSGDVLSSDKPIPGTPFAAAIENVPERPRQSNNVDGKQHGLLTRVGSIFSPRKKLTLDLKLVNSNLNENPTRPSYGTFRSSIEYEDEIRCPSGLGSAVSISSLPPSPFSPPNDSPFDPTPSPEYTRTRAISSPNLLRSLSLKVRGNARARGTSFVLHDPQLMSTQEEVEVDPPPSPKGISQLPQEVIALILSLLPRSTRAYCATMSRHFSEAARTSLYGTIDTSSFDDGQLEKLIAVLASRSDLAEVVTTFFCPCWPPFFVSDTQSRSDHSIQQKDALLTATFTLALERMFNLTSLTLPAFDVSLLAHHTAFGLRSLTFLNHTMSDSETKALFTWLDGQVNITTLRFPNLADSQRSTPLSVRTNIPDQADAKVLSKTPTSPFLTPFPTVNGNGLSPYSTPVPSPRSGHFHDTAPSQINTPFSSCTLLPNLTTLHATPTLVTLLSAPLDDGSRRVLKSVSLNINSTLYTGLRPAALMGCLRGITDLCLFFSSNVDRRSFEKVLGAAGASLGSMPKEASDDPFLEKKATKDTVKGGLKTLEISFQTSTDRSGRDEALYKSLQASLPRYQSLSTLRLSIETHEGTPQQPQETIALSSSEKDIAKSWSKTCPSLTAITLFSGAQWTSKA